MGSLKQRKYVKVVEGEADEAVELPLEEDGTLLLSTLVAHWPGSSSLKYLSKSTNSVREIRAVEGRLNAPDDGWSSNLFICVFPKGNQKVRGILVKREDSNNVDDVKKDDEFSKLSDDLSAMDFTNQKKKKKKKIFFVEDIDKAETSESTISNLPGNQKVRGILVNREEDSNNVEDVKKDDEFSKLSDDELLGMDFTNQKKKKKKKIFFVEDIDKAENSSETAVSNLPEVDETSWKGSDRDYTYDELLTRVFDVMREKNPEMASGKRQKFVMRPPQVVRIGTKKTSFANFTEICKMLHRQEKHLLDFLLAELGTSGSVDGNLQLIIKGRFQQKQIENVLRRYIKEYVTCHTCKSQDTMLQKDTRLFFLQCETCGSRCSVASIKSGFQAVTAKRATIRAKTA